MPKFFVVSDVHGYYDELIAALDNAGFDKYNSDHWLISCGDHFDRGSQPVEVMRYLISLPRKILIKGNHESLLRELCDRGYPGSNDYSNGTFDTVCEFGGDNFGRSFDECCIVAYQRTKNFIDSMLPYFETKNYVFTHGYLPVNCDDGLPMYYRRNRKFSKKDDWRESHASEWEQAMWLNSFDMVEQGFGIEKCVVAGHWHASYGRHKVEGAPEFGDGADFSPFYYRDQLIMIDTCTACSGKVNVLVLEDEFLENTP
jgi:serine/threonine protein phosphatase 1